MTTLKKKKTRLDAERKSTSLERAGRKFADEYGDVALALEIMRNARLSKPHPRYKTSRLTYRTA